MIYNHYDVQPVDPLDLWESPPFEPEVREGDVYARGAVDDKGQCFYTFAALKAFLELTKDPSLHLKVFIEGEEEIASTATMKALEEHAEALKADHLLLVDSHLAAPGVPAITLGLRGIVTMEIEVRNANQDLHSGSFGGAVLNPLRALSTAIASFWDIEGKITIPHFYDGVEPLSNEEKECFCLEFDKERIANYFGIGAFACESGCSLGEGVFVRPTLEINGLWGGYTGEGFKTVLPSTAHAKISCRLVPGQQPEQIFAHISEAFKKALPEGLEWNLKMGEGAVAFRSSPDSRIVKTVSEAYEEVMGKPCRSILLGGSIPITPLLAKISGAETVMMGYGLDEDGAHAPNERFGLDRFQQGFLTMCSIFSRLANHD
jgi:acetylornithine deacetylase/succinyl-diaminopimelate desuccinylase-like protein